MNLFETFLIIFKSSAKDVQKDVTEAGKAVDALERHLTDSDKTALKLGETFNKMIVSGVSALAAYATFNALKNGIFQSAASNFELERQSRLTGINTATIAAWDAAVAQAGGRAGEFAGWLEGINKQYAIMGLGNRSGAILHDLRAMSQAWKDAGTSMNDMLAEGAKAGIPENIVLLLAQGPQKVDALIQKYKELNGISEESAAASVGVTTALQELGASGKAIFTSLQEPMIDLLHMLKTLMDGVNLVAKDFSMRWHAWKAMFTGDKSEAEKKSASGSSSAGTMATKSNEEESKRFWLSKGFTPAQVAGILANEKRESAFRSDAVGDGGAARGIFQWHPDRQSKIMNGTGIDVTSASHAQQLQAAWWEMQQRGDDQRLKGAKTAEDAASVISKWFERPANGDYEASQRGHMASGIYSSMMGDMMAEAKNGLNTANNSPFSSQKAGSSNAINVGNITINTQAKDAKEIAAEIRNEMTGQYRTVIGNWDDGVKY